MAIEIVLILVAILLSCGSLGMILIRLTNPLLKGLGWLGGAFAVGGVGAMLLLLDARYTPLLTVTLADVLVLAAFALLHIAVLELEESDSLFSPLSAIFLLLQAASDLYYLYVPGASHIRVVVVGLLIAAQTAQTAILLLRTARLGIRAPALFTATILFTFSAANCVRSLALTSGMLTDRRLFYKAEVATFTLFLTVGLGIAMGFFWMTTARLTYRLEQMASTDHLTRLYNRRVFLRWTEKERLRSQRSDLPFTILMLDIDHFKRINDTFGHHTGDLILCAVVEKMQSAVRGIDIIGRWGGEEFVALLPGASSEAGLLVAERVRGNVQKIFLPAADPGLPGVAQSANVTASIGVATFLGGDDSVDAMLYRADMALYEAKSNGRNRVVALAAVPAPSLLSVAFKRSTL